MLCFILKLGEPHTSRSHILNFRKLEQLGDMFVSAEVGDYDSHINKLF